MGETHYDNKMEFDRENREDHKIMSQAPRPTKRASSSPWSRLPGLLYGPAGPSRCHLALSFVLGQVCGPYDLFSSIMLSILN